MTIKEIETLSEMDRANIRFYEREGLITPERMDNGYSDELPQVFYPWRRLLARMLDIFIYGVLWSIFLIFAFHVNIASRSNMGNIFDGFMSLVIMLFLEPLLLHLFGTTPGKAIFGLRIETPEGRRLFYREGLERTWGVVGTGMGYNIPIYRLVRLWKSYKICSENETQSWDECISYTIKDTKGYRGVLLVGAHAVIIALLATAISAQQLPPNRGNLTVAEFVENYNYYADFFDIDFGDKYLDENGEWVKKAFNGTAYIEIGNTEMPEYSYTMENGYVTGVFFVVEIKNNQGWISSYDTPMLLASLSFVGAQDEMGLFSKAPNRIVEHIDNNTLEDFNFIESGIEFACNTEHSGYMGTHSDLLLPDENEAENYFRLQFSMNKVK